jgi:guanylate kinase
VRKNIAIFLFGASGAGKTTIKKAIQEHFINFFYIPREVTTRPKRPDDEFDRINYSQNDFDTGVKNGSIICPIKIFGDDGPSYGFIKADMEKDIPILEEVEDECFDDLLRMYGEKMYVFAIRWEMNQYRLNMLSRGSRSESNLRARLVHARDIHKHIPSRWKKRHIYKLYNVNSHFIDGTDLTDKEIIPTILSDIEQLINPTH